MPVVNSALSGKFKNQINSERDDREISEPALFRKAFFMTLTVSHFQQMDKQSNDQQFIFTWQ